MMTFQDQSGPSPGEDSAAPKPAIDPRSIRVPKTTSEVSQLDNDDVPQPPSVSLDVTNAAFISAIFNSVPDGACVAICSKRGDPSEAVGGWYAEKASHVDQQCPPDRNNYINCSTFIPTADGALRALKEHFDGFYFLLLDDVGTKIDRERLAGFVPTWEIETSPGNFQMGIKLDVPMSDPTAIKALQDAVITAGLCDPGASGLARWARLPNAINGKAKYRNAADEPYRCRLTAWNPQTAYRVEALVQQLGLDLAPVPAPRSRTTPAVGRADQEVMHADDVFRPAPRVNRVLEALSANGLFKRTIEPGKHDITCPWVDQHTDQIDGGCVYFEPTSAYPVGGFRCQHSHGDRFHIGDLVEHLGLTMDEARCKPRIRLVPGDLNRVRVASEYVLARHGAYYCRGGAIVTVAVDPASGDVTTALVGEQHLTMALAEAADWERKDGRSKEWKRCDPPPRNVQMLLKSESFEHIPPLKGLARQPFFREGGATLVRQPGYDSETGWFASFDPDAFPLPEPTYEAAVEALGLLNELLDEFHFASETDRAAALSAMLTGAVRSTLAVAPAFNITAASPGSGKSYLAATIAPFAGSGKAANVSYPTTSEEATKAMLALLLGSPAAIVFDDMQTDWIPHGAMNRMLTSDTMTDRILGSSRAVSVSTRALIMGTGNNIGPIRDMCRRVISIRLAPCSSSPATLRYRGRPAELVRKNRDQYVAAALTITSAWKAAGSPRGDVANIASFGDEWADHCRHPLIWLGLADPAQSLFDQINDDPDSEAVGHLMAVWFDHFESQSVTVRRLLEKADLKTALMDALTDLPVVERGFVNRSKLGWLLKKYANRIINGMEIRKAVSSERNAWCVVAVAEEGKGGKGGSPLMPAFPPFSERVPQQT